MAIPAENGWDCRGPRSRPCARVLRPATVQAFFEAPRPPRNAIPARGPVDDTHRSEHVSGERGAIAADGPGRRPGQELRERRRRSPCPERDQCRVRPRPVDRGDGSLGIGQVRETPEPPSVLGPAQYHRRPTCRARFWPLGLFNAGMQFPIIDERYASLLCFLASLIAEARKWLDDAVCVVSPGVTEVPA